MGKVDDEALVASVNKQINSGTKEVVIPASLLLLASKDALEAVRQLCKLAGVGISVRG